MQAQVIAIRSNRHPIDELADVREQLKALKDREDALRTEISAQMGSHESLAGENFIAVQQLTSRKGAIDETAMKRAGIDCDSFRKAATTVYSLRLVPAPARQRA